MPRQINRIDSDVVSRSDRGGYRVDDDLYLLLECWTPVAKKNTTAMFKLYGTVGDALDIPDYILANDGGSTVVFYEVADDEIDEIIESFQTIPVIERYRSPGHLFGKTDDDVVTVR